MAWRPLQISPSAGKHLPPLLISTSFTNATYTIQVTDLAHIWSESLSHQAIIRRSKEEGTSIDPSDADQLQIFMEKLKLGLGGGPNTTLALTVNADADRPSLSLKTSIVLPGGFAPLEWRVQLSPSPQFAFMSHLVLPLLQARHVHLRETASLVEVLKEKDHIIQKLLDKMESQGTELSEVFPQAAGKGGRKVDRGKAEERVRSLAMFDTQTWRKTLNLHESQDIAQLMNSIFMDGDVQAIPSESNLLSDPSQDVWWKNIKGSTVSLGNATMRLNGTVNRATLSARPAVKRQDTAGDDDDAFQVQSTPPHLAKSIQNPAPKSANSISDDDDLDAQSQSLSQRSKIPDSFPVASPPPPSPKPKKQLGKIGGKKVDLIRKSPTHGTSSPGDEGESSQKPIVTKGLSKQQLDSDGDEMSTEDESLSSPNKPISPLPKSVPSKPIKKLGKIGGKKAAPPPEREATPPPAQPVTSSKAPLLKKGKLGKIGGKKKALETESAHEVELEVPEADQARTELQPLSPSNNKTLGFIGGQRPLSPSLDKEEGSSVKNKDESQDRGRASTRQKLEQTPDPRETSTERAERRRAELKRDLAEKAKVPVKKKRKF